MISVIIPTYNRAFFLEKAIKSVLDQTLACDEVIIVDDGSTDNSAEIIMRIQRKTGKKLRYFHQENKGTASAKNKGIIEARNDTLCFLDSDDCFHKEKLAIQYGIMKKNPDYLISHTKEIWYRRGKILNQKKKHQPPHGDIFGRSLKMCVVGMSTVMMKTLLFEKYGLFDESLVCCEDYDLWLRMSAREPFLLIDRPLTIKDGGRSDQLSHLYRLGMDKYRIKSLCNLLEIGILNEEQYQMTLMELELKSAIYGNGCLRHGKKEEAEHYLSLVSRYK